MTGDLQRARTLAEEGILHQESAVQLNPRLANQRYTLLQSRRVLAGVLRQTGALPDAVTAGRRALEVAERLAADFPERALYQIQVLDTAVEFGKALVATNPEENRPEAERVFRQALDFALRVRTRSPEALAAPHRLLEADAHAGLASIDRDRGRLGDAESHYRQALALDSRSKSANNNLVWLLARSVDAGTIDLAELVRLASTATELMPAQPLPWATLALCTFALRIGPLPGPPSISRWRLIPTATARRGS